MRLASSPVALAAKIQFVLTAHGDHLEQVDQRLRDRIELRIDLERWCDDEIREFLLAALPNAKNVDKIFTADAIAGLQRGSCGISRKVRPLVQLAILAAESQWAQIVDGATVAAIRAEMTV